MSSGYLARTDNRFSNIFADLIEWLTTPCPSAARRLGYLREAIAVRNRYLRHRENWRPHLDATRAFAERAAAPQTDRCHTWLRGSS